MITVLFPVYNEEEILRDSVLQVHRYLEERGFLYEIVAVSNGSTDRTVAIGTEMAREYPWFRFFHIEERGVGRAFVVGAREARGESIISLDIDLPTELSFIDYAQDLLKYCDMVVGSKSMGNQSRALTRVLGSQLYILVAQLVFRLTISDYAPSTKAFRRDALLKALQHLDPWTGYVFELCLYFRIHNLRVVQIGVDCEDRRKSRFNLFHEGFYRYSHLYRCFKALRNRSSWYYTS